MSRMRTIKEILSIDIFSGFHFSSFVSRHRSYHTRMFLHQLAACVEVGLDLSMALDVCIKEASRREVKRALRKVKNAVEEGALISEAMREHAPKLMPEPYYGIMEIGEKSGTLAKTLKMLERQHGETTKMKYMIIGSMIYPFQVVIVCVGIAFFLLVKVVPTFAEIFSDLGRSLPVSTELLILLSEHIRHNLFYLIAIIVIAFAVLAFFIFLARRLSTFGWILLKVPFIGPLICHTNQFRFSSLMSILLKSGVSIHDALILCERDTFLPPFRKSIEAMEREVSEGKSFSEAIIAKKPFSPTVKWLVSVGEERGDLGDSLSAAAEYENAQGENIFRLFWTLIEPAILLSMSFGMGCIIFALWSPIIDLGSLL